MQLFYIKWGIYYACLFVNDGRIFTGNLWSLFSLKIIDVLIVILADLDILWGWVFCDFLVIAIALFVIVKVNKLVGINQLLSKCLLHLWPVLSQTLQVKVSINLFLVKASRDSGYRMRAALVVADSVLLKQGDFQILIFG